FLARTLIGRADEAIQLAELITSAPQRARVLSVIVSGLADAQDLLEDKAVLAAQRAAQAVRVIADADQRVAAIEYLLNAWMALFEKNDSLTETGISAVLELAQELFSTGTRAAVLYALG